MKAILFSCALALAFGLSASAKAQQDMKAQQDFKLMTAEELKGMMDKGAKLVVVDVRTRAEYRQGHLPKAINVEPERYSFIESFLPKDRKKLHVFYCRGWG